MPHFLRRNPSSRNPRRTGGPPASAYFANRAEAELLEAKAALRTWIDRRGCPAGVAQSYIECLRGAGTWWHRAQNHELEETLPTVVRRVMETNPAILDRLPRSLR